MEQKRQMVDMYRKILGYQPMRMKPVHFATSLLLSITKSYRGLQLLNIATTPKATEKRPEDMYVTGNFLQLLKTETPPPPKSKKDLLPQLVQQTTPSPIASDISEKEVNALRMHLHAAYNNDSALYSAFSPYSAHGHDYSTPSPQYLSNHSKNHGDAGAMVCNVLEQSADGKSIVSLSQKLFQAQRIPSAILGSPFVETETEREYIRPDMSNEFAKLCDASFVSKMAGETKALMRLCETLHTSRPAYTLRYLILGFGAWFLSYLIKLSAPNSPLLFFDFSGGIRERVRTQAKTCFASSITSFGNVLQNISKRTNVLSTEDNELLSNPEFTREYTRQLEEHFRDFSIRIGWAQPRAGSVKEKHFETSPDALRVLLMSVLEADEIVPLDEVAKRLEKTWGMIIGLVPEDHARLHAAGYAPLDHDYDLQANRQGFKNLAIDLGLAVEPSDGLVLCCLSPQMI